jgi:uncharacterized membrane protein (DUF485 family)
MQNLEARLHAIAGKRWRIAIILSILMLAAYYAFILLVAFNRPLLSGLVSPGLSLGILLGALVIVCAWVLTAIYTTWANTSYDTEIHELVEASHAGR